MARLHPADRRRRTRPISTARIPIHRLRVRDLPAQRRDRLPGRLGQMRDLAEFGLHSGGEDDGLWPARHHRGAGEQDVPAVDQVIRSDRARLTRFGQRLTGDDRVIDA